VTAFGVREGPRLRGLPVFGAAAAGLVLGHALAYLIAIPDPHQRSFALQRAGHAYLPALDQLAIMLAIAAVAAVVIRAFAPSDDGGTERSGRLAALLVVVQATGFVGQEVLERLVSGAPLADLGHDHILVIGLVVQVVLAVPAAMFLRALARVSARVSARLATTVAVRAAIPRNRSVFALPVKARRPYVALFATDGSVRAPPSS
jgi:hypothetical protein